MKLLCLAIITTLSLNAFEYGLKPSQIGDKIYCFFGKAEVMNKTNNGNMANSCYVDSDNVWVVIDSGPTYSYAKQSYEAMRKIKKQDITYVINTHSHDDHWLGNHYYKSIGAKIVGSKLFKEEISLHEKTRMQTLITKEAYGDTKVTLPSIYVDKEALSLPVRQNSFKIIPIKSQAHSRGDLIVFFPGIKALFAGDLIFTDRIPVMRDANINGWIKSLEMINRMDATTVIGGHGKISSKQATVVTLNYLLELKKNVQDAIEDGIEIEEAVSSIKMLEYKDTPMYDSVHKKNVESVYRTLEWADE